MKINIKILGYEFKMELSKQEKFPVVVDQAQTKKDADAIRNSETFKNILAQAKRYRAQKKNWYTC